MMPHAPRLWGRKAAAVLAARGKQTAWKSPRLGGGLRQGLFPKAASTRTLQHHLTPYTCTHIPPMHMHTMLFLLSDTAHRLLSVFCMDLQRGRLQIFFLLSWCSLATSPVWTAHPNSHCAIGFLSEWMSSLLRLWLVTSEPFLQRSVPR